MWIAHFSDLHLTREGQALYGQVDTRAAFQVVPLLFYPQ